MYVNEKTKGAYIVKEWKVYSKPVKVGSYVA